MISKRKICECGCCDDNNVMHLPTHNKNRTVQLEELIVQASLLFSKEGFTITGIQLDRLIDGAFIFNGPCGPVVIDKYAELAQVAKMKATGDQHGAKTEYCSFSKEELSMAKEHQQPALFMNNLIKERITQAAVSLIGKTINVEQDLVIKLELVKK